MAGLGDRVSDGAAGASLFRAVGIREDAELLYDFVEEEATLNDAAQWASARDSTAQQRSCCGMRTEVCCSDRV